MFLICGLGNPGKKYFKTRHNIGFVLIEKLISNYNFVTVKKDKKKSQDLFRICQKQLSKLGNRGILKKKKVSRKISSLNKKIKAI